MTHSTAAQHIRRRIIGLPAIVIACAVLAALSVTAFATRHRTGSDDAAIEKRMGTLRKLPLTDRVRETRQLALDIRQIPNATERVQEASGLANLVTEVDCGHDTLQDVATTLSDALKDHPEPDERGQPSYSYTILAQLVRYEHVTTSLSALPLTAAMKQIEVDDRVRADANFTLKDLSGTPWTLRDLRGKVVLVNFWATWCPPCRAEIPDIESLYNRFKAKGFVVLGITDETMAKVQPFVSEHSMTYPVLLDTGRKVNELYRVPGIPRTVIYDRNGKLAAEAIDARSMRQFLALLAKAGLK